MSRAYPLVVTSSRVDTTFIRIDGDQEPQVLVEVNVTLDPGVPSGVIGTRMNNIANVRASTTVFDALTTVLAAGPAEPAMVVLCCQNDGRIATDLQSYTYTPPDPPAAPPPNPTANSRKSKRNGGLGSEQPQDSD